MGLREIAAGHERIVRELNEERAAALVRISRVLESLIDQLHATRVRMESLGELDAEREMARYRQLHRMASEYRWFLEVQREAIGLRQHHMLDERYVIPPAIR